MNKIKFFSICLLGTLGIASSIIIECKYSIQSFYILKQIYACKVGTVTSPAFIDAYITGNHMANKSFDDVIGLHGSIGKAQKFPKSLKDTFKNLKAIHFYNGQIKELIAEDIKPFPELVELYFYNNKIQVIEKGTFEFNPKLAGISFKSNKLIHVSANVFDHLKNLKYLWLDENPCPNSVARNSRKAALKIIATAKSTCQSPAILRLEWKVEGNCPPTTIIRISEPSNKCKNIDEIFEGYSQKIVDMKAQCGNPESEDVKRKIEDFEIEYGNMHSMFNFTLDNKFKDLKNHLNC